MKCIFVLVLMVCASGCNSGGNATSTSVEQGSWAVTGNVQCTPDCGSSVVPKTYTVVFVSSPCTVQTPVGTFSVEGPACFVANNSTGEGSISGIGIPKSPKGAGHGVLIGVPSDPVPADATVKMLFVAADKNGNLAEFTGDGKIADGTITGAMSCSAKTPICQGASATFSAIHQ